MCGGLKASLKAGISYVVILLLAYLFLPIAVSAQTPWSGESQGGRGQTRGGQEEQGTPPMPASAQEPSVQLYTDEQRSIFATIFGEEATLSLSQDEAALLAARIAELARYRKELETMAPERRRMMRAMMDQINEEAVLRAMPAPPEVIREIRTSKRDSDRASERPLEPVHLAMRTVHHEFDSVNAIELRVSPAYVSTLIFLDASGSPWPIAHQVLGDSSAVNSQIVKDGGGNVAVMQNTAASRFRESSAMFILRDAQTPITVRILGDDRVVDARLTVQVPVLGPMSDGKRPIGDDFSRRDPRVMALLGNPNQDFVVSRFRFIAQGDSDDVLRRVEAIRTDDGRVFVRGPMRLVSPSWTQEVTSQNGMKIYEVPPVHQFIFAVEGEHGGHGYIHAHLETEMPVSIPLKQPPDELIRAGS